MCDSPAYELYSTYLFIKDNKPRFVDLGDEIGELVLELKGRQHDLKSLRIFYVYMRNCRTNVEHVGLLFHIIRGQRIQ